MSHKKHKMKGNSLLKQTHCKKELLYLVTTLEKETGRNPKKDGYILYSELDKAFLLSQRYRTEHAFIYAVDAPKLYRQKQDLIYRSKGKTYLRQIPKDCVIFINWQGFRSPELFFEVLKLLK